MSSVILGRVIRQTTAAAPLPSGFICHRRCAASPTAISTRRLCQTTRQHQRRHSSSKASASSGRVGRRKGKETSVMSMEPRNQTFSQQYPHLPSVPSTSHLKLSDIEVSSFFSCHRPISVTTAVPATVSDASFKKIFEPQSPTNKEKHQEVILTLGNVVDSLEYGVEGGQEESGLQWQVMQDNLEGPVMHLDGPSGDVALKKFISRCRPFRPPPPPQAAEDFTKASEKRPKKAKKTVIPAEVTQPKKKSWSTTIIVTEQTWPSGEKTYQATTSDIVQVKDPVDHAVISDPQTPQRAPIQQPFLQRMLIRRQRSGQKNTRFVPSEEHKPAMMLISVKRQRKLKMKKHKYKKLMRRTRSLRRRLGKA